MDTANPPQTYHLKVLSRWYYPLLFISLITLIVLLTLVSDFIDEQFGQGTGNYTSLAGVLACYLLFDLVIKKRLRTPLQIHFDGKQLQLDYFTRQHVLRNCPEIISLFCANGEGWRIAPHNANQPPR